MSHLFRGSFICVFLFVIITIPIMVMINVDKYEKQVENEFRSACHEVGERQYGTDDNGCA